MSSYCLWNPMFVSMIIYGCCAIIAYIVTCSVIILKRKFFKGTFFKLYLILSVVNIFVFLVRFPVIRLPLFTGRACAIEYFFENGHFSGLEIIHFAHWHVGDVQYILTAIIAFDRFVVLVLGLKVNKLWKRFYWFPIFMAFLFPLFSTQAILLGHSFYIYADFSDTYQIMFTAPRELLYNPMIAIQIVVVTTGVILNSFVIFHFCQNKNTMGKQRAMEMKLFLNSLSEVITSIFMIILLFIQINTDVTSPAYMQSRILVAYASDLQQLLPPFVLLLTSANLREAIVHSFRLKNNKVITITTA